MCGIAGLLSFQGDASVWSSALERSLALVARRGPDASGVWTDRASCVLGFRRLAILDLGPAAHQPMVCGDGRFVLVYNGEVYNFRELRRALELEGIRFRSTGDTEVVLQALVRWGRRALARFNGMFALAFYDAVERRLLLARDHAGMKPLYYARCRHGIVFGSQYDQILSHPWTRANALSPSSLGLFLRFDYIPAPYALHEQVHMLEPGAQLTVDATGNTDHGRFFEFPANRQPDLHDAEAFEAVDEAVTRAVRRHLVSDVPVGTFLSGGIDSPLVAAMAQRMSDAAVPAFTLGTGGDSLDESRAAADYANAIGLDHTVRHISPEDVPGLVCEASAACAEPFADFSILPTLFVAAMARRRVTVMLSGDGGDELFWGYVDRSGSVLRVARQFRKPRWQRVPGSLVRGRSGWSLRRRTIGDVYQVHHSVVRSRMLRAVIPELPEPPADFTVFHYDGWEPDRTAQWMRVVETGLYLPHVLLKVDRASMYHSLEVRMPLLDREVVDVASRIDWRSCLDLTRNIGKRPLRHALARRVEHQTVLKRGFAVPMDEWMRGPLRPLLSDVVLERTELLGLRLRRGALLSLYRQHQSGSANHSWLFWRLLSLCLWSDRFGACRDAA